MIRLSKLGAALLVLISVTGIALLAEILYLLWRRRFFFRPRNTPRGPCPQDLDFAAERKISMPFMSKELLRYLCCKHSSRIEPNEAVHASSSSPSAISSPSSSEELEEEEHLKWFGRPRLLFTIKEEESEGVDSENGSSVENSSSSSIKKKRFGFEDDSFGAVVSDMTKATTVPEEPIDMKETTPFSTPCASPPYLTPLSSPSRDVELGTSRSWDALLLKDSRSKNNHTVLIR